MRYQGTAVQIYDVPAPLDPNVRLDRRLSTIVAAMALFGLAVFLGFILFGIATQRM